MRKVGFLLLFLTPVFGGCTRKRDNSEREFTAKIRMVTPFTQPSVQTGKLYMSKGRLRVELGPMAIVYIVNQRRGWEMFPEGKEYFDIGEKQVSTYLPHLTNGSPCPNVELPPACKMLAKEDIQGRWSTKWELVNQHAERIYLWTDDQLGIAARWHIENVTYDLTEIHEGGVADNMFELPAGYTKFSETFQRGF